MALIALNPAEARTAAALFARMFPEGEDGPGATAIGVVDYLDRALAAEYAEWAETYRVGLAALDRVAREEHGTGLADCAARDQDDLIERLEHEQLDGFRVPGQREFFALLRALLQEGLFADPAYGGRMLEHVQAGELDPSFLLTHRMPLEDGPRGYEMFKTKEDACLRAAFTP